MVDWRETLRTLLTQFESKATASKGLYHLFIEVADDEREQIQGPSWFDMESQPLIIDGKPKMGNWDCCRFETLPGTPPRFREPKECDHPIQDESRPVKDGSGKVQAVFEPAKQRMGYLCGPESPEFAPFESLANALVQAISNAKDLQEHYLGAELVEVFRRPRGGIRYAFGEVPMVPDQFIASGWQAGVAQFENGVLIDLPIGGSEPSSKDWLILLHKLAWRSEDGGGLSAKKVCWAGNTEAELDFLNFGLEDSPPDFAKQFDKISRNSFYSVLGSKDAPLDVYLASVFAIKLLLAELDAKAKGLPSAAPSIDYSNESWAKLSLPKIKTVKVSECREIITPKIGLLVATEVERQAMIKRMRPPKSKRAVLKVFSDKNTYFLGRLGVTEVAMCMVAMGSIGRDSSALVTTEFIDEWNLSAVVMAGIAFGKDAAKQQIGQVLVSDRVISYEPQRVGEATNQDRGEIHSAGATLLNRFRNVTGWNFEGPTGDLCGVQCGPLLSGEKLIDNVEFKSDLFERYPTAIGGEMEGVGVASAASRKECEWIVVKAICDWGDGTKQKVHQEFSAAASISLVEHVFNQLGALDAISKT